MPEKSIHRVMKANMAGRPPKYLINTTTFITNLIKEGRVDEANQLLRLEIDKLAELSSEDSEIGRIIKLDLPEYRPGRKTRALCARWRNFKVSCVLYYFLLIINIFYHNRIIPFLPLCLRRINESRKNESTNKSSNRP